MKFIKLTIGVVLLITSSAWAKFSGPDVVGNGGDAVVCRDAMGSIVAAEVLDLYEARIIHDRESNLDASKTVAEILEDIRINLSMHETSLNKTLKEYTDSFEEETLFLDDVELSDIEDSAHIIVPNGCKVEQVVIQNEPSAFNPKRYTVNNEIWSKFDNLNKAAMTLHEALYRVFLENLTARDSRLVRLILSYLISDDLNTNLYDMLALVQQIGFKSFSLRTQEGLIFTKFETDEEGEFKAFKAEVEAGGYILNFGQYDIKLLAGSRLNLISKGRYQVDLTRLVPLKDTDEKSYKVDLGSGDEINTNNIVLEGFTITEKTPNKLELELFPVLVDKEEHKWMENTLNRLPIQTKGQAQIELNVKTGDVTEVRPKIAKTVYRRSQREREGKWIVEQRLGHVKFERVEGACQSLLKSAEGYICVGGGLDTFEQSKNVRISSYTQDLKPQVSFLILYQETGFGADKKKVFFKKIYNRAGVVQSRKRKFLPFELPVSKANRFDDINNIIKDDSDESISLRQYEHYFAEAELDEKDSVSFTKKGILYSLTNEMSKAEKKEFELLYPEYFEEDYNLNTFNVVHYVQ